MWKVNLSPNCAVEVAVHTILYVRQIYPADLFIRRKKYDTPVFQSRHPALNAYISGAVKAVGEELKLVSVITLRVCLVNSSCNPNRALLTKLLLLSKIKSRSRLSVLFSR